MKEKNLKKVKIISGLFRGEIGFVTGSFSYHGQEFIMVRITRVTRLEGQWSYTWTSVTKEQVEETTEKELFKEI